MLFTIDVFQNESLYRGILRSLLHPLGHPSVKVGLRPGDLIDHLREVSGVVSKKTTGTLINFF